MTDDAEISPLVENSGQHWKLLFGRRGQELHPTVWTTAFNFVGGKEKHISDLQHLGNMFIVFVDMKENTRN